MNFYHIIPLKTDAHWFTHDRIFYFQLGKCSKHERLVEKYYHEITEKCLELGQTFVFHKYCVENIHRIPKVGGNNELFLNKIASIPEEQYYDELAWQGFAYQAMDPVYIIRRYNEKCLIAWGYHAFRKSKGTIRFPFEALLPLNDIAVGPACEYDVMDVLAKRNIFNIKME